MALSMDDAQLRQATEKYQREIIEVASLMNRLGYRMTEAGVYRSLLLLDDGFSPAEVAMTVALLSFALDVRAAPKDLTVLGMMSIHALEMIEIMGTEVDEGRMNKDIFLENATLLRLVGTPGPAVRETLESLLQGSTASGERPAVSRISYKKPKKRWWPF